MRDKEFIDEAESAMQVVLKEKRDTTILLEGESKVGTDTYRYRRLQSKLQSLVYLENLVLRELQEMLR